MMVRLVSGAGTVVGVSDALAARLRRQGYHDGQPGVVAADTPQPEGPSGDEPPTCPDCGFVAKTAAGLGSHRRRHED